MATPTGDVTAAILAALRGIRRDAGYRTTPAEVLERKTSFGRVGRFPALTVETQRERVTAQPASRRRRTIRLLVTGYVRPGADRDAKQEARDLLADVEDALTADPTLGGKATFLLVREAAFDFSADEAGGRAGCVVEVVVHEGVGRMS